MQTFNQIVSSYLISPEYNSLDEISKRAYKQVIDKLTGVLGDYSFGVEDNMVVSSEMRAKLAKDVIFVYNKLNELPTSNAKNRYRLIFKLVWIWAERSGIVDSGSMNNLQAFKQEHQDLGVFTKEDIQKIASVPKLPDWIVPYRNMLLFCFYSGIRPNEAQNIKVKDIDDEFVYIKYAKGRAKGEVARMCRITPELHKLLIDVPTNPEAYIFESTSNKPLNAVMRCRATARLCAKARIPHKPFYSTRRGTATEMFKAGYDISHVQHQLGHADIKTTQRYIRPTMKDKAVSFKGF